MIIHSFFSLTIHKTNSIQYKPKTETKNQSSNSSQLKMMNSQIYLLFFALLCAMSSTCLASDATSQEHSSVKEVHTEDDTYSVPPQMLRNLKQATGNGSVARDGLHEIRPCVSMSKITDSQKQDIWGNGDKTCNTNVCAGGCCRAYNWLKCDTTNSFPYVPCICNGINTQDPTNFVAWKRPPQSIPVTRGTVR